MTSFLSKIVWMLWLSKCIKTVKKQLFPDRAPTNSGTVPLLVGARSGKSSFFVWFSVLLLSKHPRLFDRKYGHLQLITTVNDFRIEVAVLLSGTLFEQIFLCSVEGFLEVQCDCIKIKSHGKQKSRRNSWRGCPPLAPTWMAPSSQGHFYFHCWKKVAL